MEDIRNKFIDYLITQKNYPKESFLKDAYIIDTVGKNQKTKIYSDLAILDVDSNNYLALVEFKSSFANISKLDLDLFERYLTVLNQQGLVYYFVIPSEDNFRIYITNENGFVIIENDDFPDYKTLSSKVLSDSKRSKILGIESDENEKKKKKEVFITTLAATVVSLIAALVISNGFIDKNLFNSKSEEIQKLEAYNKNLSEQIKAIVNQIQVVDSTKQDLPIKSQVLLKEINSRLTIVEKLIDQNPKNLMETQDINYKINYLTSILEKDKENYNIKLENIQDKLNTYTTIIFTLVVTIIGSLTAFTISTFKK